jgi:hypothetical protein
MGLVVELAGEKAPGSGPNPQPVRVTLDANTIRQVLFSSLGGGAGGGATWTNLRKVTVRVVDDGRKARADEGLGCGNGDSTQFGIDFIALGPAAGGQVCHDGGSK